MSSKNTNKINVPEARAAMDKFKMEAAADLRVRTANYERADRTAMGHIQRICYTATVTV